MAWFKRRRSGDPVDVADSADGLRHLVVAAGHVSEWTSGDTSVDGLSTEWRERLVLIATTAGARGVAQVTVVPFEGVVHGSQPLCLHVGATVLVADHSRDGRARIVEAAAGFAPGTRVTEQSLSRALVGAAGETDLVVIVGDGTRLPPNLVWELAYAEIVFVDTPFMSLTSEHIATAIEEFSMRHRRFGGVDE